MNDIRWQGFTHREIWDKVQAGPGHLVSVDTANSWVDAEKLFRAIDEDLSAATATIGAGWDGVAADATRNGLTPLGNWVTSAVAGARDAAASLLEQQQQVVWVRTNLPQPDPDPTRPWFMTNDWAAKEARSAELAQQAVHVMDTYAVNSGRNQRMLLPWLDPPQVTVAEASAGRGGSGAGGHSPSGAGGASLPSGATGTPDLGTAPTPTGAAATTPAPGPGTSGFPGGGVPGGGGTPGAHVPPGAAPSAAGVPGGVGPHQPASGGFTPAGVGPVSTRPGTDRPVGAVPPGAFRPVVPRAPDRPPAAPSWRTDPTIVGDRSSTGRGVAADVDASRPRGGGATRPWTEPAPPGRGPGAGPERVAPAGENARVAGARAGAAGHPGMMPMGSGAGGGQDREHRRPDYLVDDQGVFTDHRWVTPAVLTPENGPPPGGR